MQITIKCYVNALSAKLSPRALQFQEKQGVLSVARVDIKTGIASYEYHLYFQ